MIFCGGFLFLGIFLGFVFLMATTLIIYYKQVSEGYEDKVRFEIMQKVGMDHQTVKKSINSQVLMIFFLPLVVASIHTAFAFPIVSRLLKVLMFDNINLKFDIIVSNPPYIKTKVITTLSAEVQNEPKLALDGGEDGFKFYRIIRENVEKYLNDVSYVLMEIGYDQKEVLLDIFENAKCVQDYAGNDRVIIWRRNTKNE